MFQLLYEEKHMLHGKLFDEFIKEVKAYLSSYLERECIVLYGHCWIQGGTYLEKILQKHLNIRIDYIIDEEEISYEGKIYRRNLLQYLDPLKTSIISTVNCDLDYLEKYGFGENVNYVNINNKMRLRSFGFYQWLETQYGCDIMNRDTKIDVEKINKDYVLYGASRGLAFIPVCNYLCHNYPKKRILDLGCGKGGAMIHLVDSGYEVVDGIELLTELSDIAVENFTKIGFSCHVFNLDALEFENYAEYDLFYIYDAFRGETFGKVLEMISRARKGKGETILVYANPHEHLRIINDSQFVYAGTIDGDWITRMANVYVLK